MIIIFYEIIIFLLKKIMKYKKQIENIRINKFSNRKLKIFFFLALIIIYTFILKKDIVDNKKKENINKNIKNIKEIDENSNIKERKEMEKENKEDKDEENKDKKEEEKEEKKEKKGNKRNKGEEKENKEEKNNKEDEKEKEKENIEEKKEEEKKEKENKEKEKEEEKKEKEEEKKEKENKEKEKEKKEEEKKEKKENKEEKKEEEKKNKEEKKDNKEDIKNDEERPQFYKIGRNSYLTDETIKSFNSYIQKCRDRNYTNDTIYNISKNPKITVIIPVYNREKDLYYTIRSIQYQKMKDIEIVLINDGSTDKTLETIQKLELK